MKFFPFRFPGVIAACVAAALFALPSGAAAGTCARYITADVVAIDQVFFWNRLGAVQPQGQMFALRRDVIGATPGNAQLRPGKRPRPLVLRMNVGDCLTISFQNLLAPAKTDEEQSATRRASIHAVGMQLVNSISDDGASVGENGNLLVDPGGSAVYTLYAEREGEHVLYSAGATTGGEGDGGHINSGLFGAIIVEPAGSYWYRSQVTEEDLRLATTGTTATGYPILNYNARYPNTHARAGRPILQMLDGTEIVHTDLTAVIAGSGANNGGQFGANEFPVNPVYPNRREPFREFVTIYHDETGAVQAFPQFQQGALTHTLQSGRDGFAINYGSAGVGAEVLANRLGVGPSYNCPECKFEEFFLSSWAVGDPAMVVDVPANSPCMVSSATDPNAAGADPNLDPKVAGLRTGTNCVPTPGPKAQKAFFPDDPSNVYHGYMRDHTKFRVLHAGSREHHIHHLHAHQWLYSPDNDRSSYLDSQALGPGSSFTAEIAYEGGGNLNQTVGDSIFHCHFYPHFAQGMWALWRVHDVLEKGTVLNADGKPAGGSRALPDGEINAGSPIPALVPLPGKPMAPLPGATASVQNGQPRIDGTGNPGYPFFVPAKAGNRPPHPPLDTIDDGGLPRHRIDRAFAQPVISEAHTRFDFHKELLAIKVEKLAETGTPVEVQAMAFHATREHPTCRPDGVCDGTVPVKFLANGLPPVAGAPFADPCSGSSSVNRRYRAAAIQTDVKLNKAGWHFPQQRFFALWNDVQGFLTPGGKPPEPLFFRANSGECIEYQFTNLVPHEYKQDDFQVRTPTDVLGQHIHLVKFDVLASDGAGNGFNYEDGSFSPGEVQERIRAIRTANGCVTGDSRDGNNNVTCPLLKAHPFFGPGLDEDGDGVGDWMGAQTTVQRWKADPVLDNEGKDRTLRTVFTHDHFGPSTHQQAGLYGGLVVEPAGSEWFNADNSGALLGVPTNTALPLCTPGGGRCDGGPTSWQAVIDPPPGTPAFREFLLAFNDFQPAYPAEASTKPKAWPALAINPPGKREIGLPDMLARPYPESCPEGGAAPCPELVAADDSGTMAVNYRNEPVALRVYDPATQGQAVGLAGDLAAAFSSKVVRADTRLNTQPSFYQPLTPDIMPGDPYTPLLRTFEGERVQIRVLVGGHEEGHNFSIHGIKWRQEPSNLESGWRNSQMMGISEHYEFIVPKRVFASPETGAVDRLWSAGSSTDDYWNGIWGIFRMYMKDDVAATSLRAVPVDPEDLDEAPSDSDSCPANAVARTFSVSAITAQSLANHGSKLTYNSRVDGAFGALFDSAPILYVRDGDLDLTGTVPQLKAGVSLEPLVLRARAGECVVVNLTNRMGGVNGSNGYNTLPMLVDNFNANDLKPSKYAGLHPQLLHYGVSRNDGAWVGNNGSLSDHLVAPGQSITYRWYAGHVKVDRYGTVTAIPMEFGATNLISSDRILHASRGAFGGLVIEPSDATWPANARASAKVTAASVPGGFFNELVLQFQNDVNLRMGEGAGTPVPNLAGIEDPEDSGQKAINYRTEPLWKRMQHAAARPAEDTRDFVHWDTAAANGKVGGTDPQTPVYEVTAGEPVRFRLLQAGGHNRNIVFGLHGHVWDRQPFVANSNRLGQNGFSFLEGARMGHGPTNHADLLLRHGAGGAFEVTGDYLFRDLAGPGFDGGLWGILRVLP